MKQGTFNKIVAKSAVLGSAGVMTAMQCSAGMSSIGTIWQTSGGVILLGALLPAMLLIGVAVYTWGTDSSLITDLKSQFWKIVALYLAGWAAGVILIFVLNPSSLVTIALLPLIGNVAGVGVAVGMKLGGLL